MAARNTTTTLAPLATALGVVTFTPRSEGGYWLALDGQPLYLAPSIDGYTRKGEKPFMFTRNERKIERRLRKGSWTTIADPKEAAAARLESRKARAAARDAAKAAKAGAFEGTIAALRKALASGSQDAHLDALLAAEQAGKARKGAIAAIKARMAETATEEAPEEAPQRPRGTGRTLAANDAQPDERLARVVATLRAAGCSPAEIGAVIAAM